MVMGVDVEGASCRDGRVRARVCVVMSVWGARARVSPYSNRSGSRSLVSLARVCPSLAAAARPRGPARRAPGARRARSADREIQRTIENEHSQQQATHRARETARVCR